MVEKFGPDFDQKAQQALQEAVDHSVAVQRSDGHWCGETYANITFTAEYVFLYYSLGLHDSLSRDATALKTFFLAQQQPDGSWCIGSRYPWDPRQTDPPDASVTTEAYLALKILGQDPWSKPMMRARDIVLQLGGVESVRVFTRVFLATFGLIPWKAVPAAPCELMLLPPWFPINIYALSSWARCTLMGVLTMRHHEPLYALPNGKHANNNFLDELWCNPRNKEIPYAPSLWSLFWKDKTEWGFTVADTAMYWLERFGFRRTPIRTLARRKVIEWLEEHQEDSGDWGGYWPPMDGSLRALVLEGFAMDSDRVKRALGSIERICLNDEQGKRAQSTISPVWDTVLMISALCDAGHENKADLAVEWVIQKQGTHPGDWTIYNPTVAPGGWSFEYHNKWYPDVDDTAVGVMALLKHGKKYTDVVDRALRFCVGMQNSDGGYAAFDRNNDKEWLNKIPFGDMDSLLDPATTDVTGRLVECFGYVLTYHGHELGALRSNVESAAVGAVEWLLSKQHKCGGFWGRWGCNYVYGSSNVLCGLKYFMDRRDVAHAVDRCVSWYRSVQQECGGFGEGFDTYADESRIGIGEVTASQTAWACMGLIAVLPPEDPAIRKGIRWLVDNQETVGKKKGSWKPDFTATGFPGHLNMGYEYYAHYFPIMALGRYQQALQKSY